MGKTYIGIDPGAKGFMCIMPPEGEIRFLSFEDETPYHVSSVLKEAHANGATVVAMEDVHAMPKQGVSSTFNFGRNVGLLQGFLIAHGIPYITVRPQDWQKEIWDRSDKVKDFATGKVNPKKTSIKAARRLFPDVDLRRNSRCTAPHDGKADSLLICEYARRKNL